jgi:hypothetical protein
MADETVMETEQRLGELYHAMSDGELLELGAGMDELTDAAQGVLQRELKSRKLVLHESLPEVSAGLARSFDEENLEGGTVVLTTFHDAMDARGACEFLEDGDVVFRVKDVAALSTGGSTFGGGPVVALELIVHGADKWRAMAILRERMGLFPLQEVEEGDELSADEEQAVEMATVGWFGRREDAGAVVRVLEGAGIWSRIVEDPDGSVEDDMRFEVEVKEADQERAPEVVEREMGLAEPTVD